MILHACSNINNSKEHTASGKPNDSIMFKDGVKVAKDPFVQACIENVKSGSYQKFMNVEGYCNCLIESMALNYTSLEIKPLLVSISNSKDDLYAKGFNYISFPGMKQITISCLNANLLSNSNEKIQITSEEQKQALIKYIRQLLEQQEGYSEFEKVVNVDGYCECLTISYYRSFSVKEIITNPDIGNDPKYLMISDSCAGLNIKQ